MNVRELIEELENYSDNTEVVMKSKNCHYQWAIDEVDFGERHDDENTEVVIIQEGEQY